MAKLSISVEKALARTPERLAALLAPGVEYTGTIYRKVAYCDESGTPRGNRYIRVSGTLPTLAAARNMPELLRFLLDRGHDVNSASQAAVEALLADGSLLADGQLRSFLFASPQPHPSALYANMRSSIASGTGKRLSAPLPFEHPAFSLSGVTPLAAAILCGSVDCVRVLLERPGVWTTECPAVSVALALAWRRADPDYREACRLARTLPDTSLRPLALWSVIEENGTDFLRAELAAAPYDTAAVREAAKKLLCFYGTRLNIPPCPPPLAEKLTLLASHDPRAFQEQLLCEYLAALFLAEQGSARLRALVERFCRGRTVDLSASSSLLRAVSARELASWMLVFNIWRLLGKKARAVVFHSEALIQHHSFL